MGVIFSREAANSKMSYQPVSDRVLYVRIRASPFNMSLLQVYAASMVNCKMYWIAAPDRIS